MLLVGRAASQQVTQTDIPACRGCPAARLLQRPPSYTTKGCAGLSKLYGRRPALPLSRQTICRNPAYSCPTSGWPSSLWSSSKRITSAAGCCRTCAMLLPYAVPHSNLLSASLTKHAKGGVRRCNGGGTLRSPRASNKGRQEPARLYGVPQVGVRSVATRTRSCFGWKGGSCCATRRAGIHSAELLWP